MELTEEEYNKLTEDEKRLYRRKQTKDGNKILYKIAKRKGLRYREDILDNMGGAELGANIFRITQTEALLEKQEEPNEKVATATHYKVGKTVRKAIEELGGTMPEDLPTPKKSIKELEKDELKKIGIN
jgi:DNA-damage-inducible protein D